MTPSLRDLFGKPQRTPAPTPQAPTLAMRELLFGDMPVDQWPARPIADRPWSQFMEAAQAFGSGDRERAVTIWQTIAATPGLEPRHTLQAWTFLRAHGVQPSPDEAHTVYGVVAEVAMPQGLDLLAAYADHSARYYNFSGAGAIWEHPDDRLDSSIDRLLDAGRQVVAVIGPWEDARPGPPPTNQARISMLTPSGLYFGQGSLGGLSSDPNGKRLVDSATALMLQMTQLPRQ